jgi:hypothetical protein
MLTDFFKSDVEIIRPGLGGYIDGVWLNSPSTTFIIRADVQPAPATVMDTLPEGYRTRSVYVLYTNTELFTSEDDLSNPDIVVLYGKRYFVTKKEIRDRTIISHYKIIVVKEEKDVN